MLPVSLLLFSSVILTLFSLQNGKAIFCIFRKKSTHPHTITYIYITCIKTFDPNKHLMSFLVLIHNLQNQSPKKKSTSTRSPPQMKLIKPQLLGRSAFPLFFGWKDLVLPTDGHVIICKEVSEKETKTLHVELLR